MTGDMKHITSLSSVILTIVLHPFGKLSL